MEAIQYYKKVMTTGYAKFDGRASRSEYWYFVLVYVVLYLLVGALDAVLGTTMAPETSPGQATHIGIMATIFALVHFLPSLAVAARRLHDQDKSGWMMLIALIPFVGMIILLIMMCLKGTDGPNRFGAPSASE